MAICTYFRPSSMNSEQYQDISRRLEAAGVGAPTGRMYHICFGEGNGLQVFSVWDSQEAFDAFGQKLMPIFAEVGVVGEPMVEKVENIIVG